MGILKSMLIFGLGATTGSVVTYFLVKDTIQAEADRETEEFMIHFRNKMSKYKEKNTETTPKSKSEEDHSEEEKKKVWDEYSSIVDGYARTESEYNQYGEGIEEIEDIPEPKDKSDEPYPIDQYIFENDDSYSKEELFYYDENKILVNEDDQPVDILEYIGDRGRLEIESFTSEPMFWVRNDQKDTDFAITRVYSSYNGME